MYLFYVLFFICGHICPLCYTRLMSCWSYWLVFQQLITNFSHGFCFCLFVKIHRRLPSVAAIHFHHETIIFCLPHFHHHGNRFVNIPPHAPFFIVLVGRTLFLDLLQTRQSTNGTKKNKKWETMFRVSLQPCKRYVAVARTRFTDSRLRTWRSVCELSKIFMYAASVSWMVWSYSLRACCLRCKLSLILLKRSVKIARSFWIFAFSSSSFKICRFTSSRFSRRSSIHLTNWLL